MPCTLRTPLPTEAARSDILLRMLKSEEIDDDVNITSIAERTEGFSGSDLKELCRVASLQRIKELGKQPSTGEQRIIYSVCKLVVSFT
jgi:SpoVK/Ycf46/Vps4 family AAA+-type ATPase